MVDILTLSGDYGFEQFRLGFVRDLHIDARTAEWSLANIGDVLNRYPVLVTDAHNVVIQGGRIVGHVPLDTDWIDTYINSAAVHARDSDQILFRDWQVTQAWDAIRITGDDDDAQFSIENVWLSDVRDDAVENDDGLTGVIRDSLFDRVFVGVSLADSGTSDQTDRVVTLDNVLIRMGEFIYRGEETHQSIFKVEAEKSPSLIIENSVFAISNVDHRGQNDLQDAWDSVIGAENNVFLNLSDEPLPDDYALPPDGFVVLQGREARAYWQDARDEFISDWYDSETGGRGEASMVGDALMQKHTDADPLLF